MFIHTGRMLIESHSTVLHCSVQLLLEDMSLFLSALIIIIIGSDYTASAGANR